MKKTFVLALMAAGLIASAAVSAAEKAYTNGIDPNYPPFAYVDEKTGQPNGFDVEALNWIAKAQGVVINHKPIAWDGIIPALLAGQIDMIASGMSITEKRKKQVDFTDPYWRVSRVFITKSDSSLTPEDILSKKIKLGVQRGTSEAAAIREEQKQKKYPFQLRNYDNAPLAVEDLLNGRIDAALMDSLPAENAIASGRSVKIVGTHFDPDDFGAAVRKEDTELKALLNEGYRKLKADPFWKELQDKYLKDSH